MSAGLLVFGFFPPLDAACRGRLMGAMMAVATGSTVVLGAVVGGTALIVEGVS